MINATFAIAPTAPGQPAKGASPVGGELFALSMIAVGASDGIVPNGAADTSVRQALAVPGIALPTPAGTDAVDPALAWLPAVDIPVPAPLDIPPALANVASDPAAASSLAQSVQRSQPLLRSGAAIAALTAPTLASVASQATRPERTSAAAPVPAPMVVTKTWPDAPVLPNDAVQLDNVIGSGSGRVAATGGHRSTSAALTGEGQPAVNVHAQPVESEPQSGAAPLGRAASGVAAPVVQRVPRDMAPMSMVQAPSISTIVAAPRAMSDSSADQHVLARRGDVAAPDRAGPADTPPAATRAQRGMAIEASSTSTIAAAPRAVTGPLADQDTSKLPSDTAAPDVTVPGNAPPVASRAQRNTVPSPMVDVRAETGDVANLQPPAIIPHRDAKALGSPPTSLTIESPIAGDDVQTVPETVIQPGIVVAGDRSAIAGAPVQPMIVAQPDEAAARDAKLTIVSERPVAATSRPRPSPATPQPTAGEALPPREGVVPPSQPAANPPVAAITQGDVTPASQGPVTAMPIAHDDGPTDAAPARKAATAAAPRPHADGLPTADAARSGSATALTADDGTDDDADSAQPSPPVPPAAFAAILPPVPQPIAVPIDRDVASPPQSRPAASDGRSVATVDRTAVPDRLAPDGNAVRTPVGSVPASVRDDVAATTTRGETKDRRHAAKAAGDKTPAEPAATDATAGRAQTRDGDADRSEPPSTDPGAIAAARQGVPPNAQASTPVGASSITPGVVPSRPSKRAAPAMQAVDGAPAAPRQNEGIAPVTPRIETPVSAPRPAVTADAPARSNASVGSSSAAPDTRMPSAPGTVARIADADPAGTPIVAVAAPVGVAGTTLSPDPVAPGLPVTPAEPRPTFMREVAGNARQTVALAPQSREPSQPIAGITAPAAQVFGAAMHAAGVIDERKRIEPSDPSIAAAVAASPVREVAATADAGQPTLDMRQDGWPTHMVDHIEALRDAANANDTRIRLVPDALGAIDIAVKTVGDAIHVRFAAEDATTRAMIEDAQPRLAEIAQERGLKIGQTIVEPAAAQSQSGAGQSNAGASHQQPASQPPAGNGQQQPSAQAQAGQQQPRQQQQQQAAAPRQPAAPPRAPSHDTDAAGNGRIA
ncbi:hypothetical protein FHT00_002042 [Sphingomonas insulae]|uniref:Flagellar hook-length control protein-like C-terminal domain-containing protein n=1 Tax=Sphingomonas insulae TaxID=424800 RepID=A0ABN1HN79_9SPHN|nr:flagellar hook-length control protein FliK [Sphingomonas insulae]NIJ30079.1 hypothetical protein [Sphingomonas insulae]